MNKKIIGLACIAIAIGIVIGAFGAHKLQEILSPKQTKTFETAVKYWFYNSLGILLLGSILDRFKLNLTGIIIIALGTIVFCFALWLNAILGIKVFGMIAPIGGLAMVLGWMWTGIQIIKSK